MRYRHVIVEHILITITAFWGICALADNAVAFTFLLWLLVLGFMQVVHSLIIAFNYWDNKKIRTAICMYWVAAAIDLILLWSGNDGKASDLPFFIIGIPLAIAVYLWGLTWYFHRQAIAEEMQKQVRNQLDIGS